MSEFKEKARQELITFVQNSGLTRSESEVAINNCVDAIGKNAQKGFEIGTAVAIFMNAAAPGVGPLTAIGVMAAATGVKAAITIKNSQHCSELRSAILYWRSGRALTNQIDHAFQLP